MPQQTAISLDDVLAARQRIQPWIARTPLATSRTISEMAGVEVRLKCENLQRAGAFKIRGAMNALLGIEPDARKRGVVAFSSGNHAQGVALAAKLLGIPATIVMPENSVQSKVDATLGYGARVVQAGVTAATRDAVARSIAEESGATVIPPFDHPSIIAGAGSVGLEIAEEWPEVKSIIAPLGGGGLLAGVSLAAKSMLPHIDVYGVEPELGDDGQQSFRRGEIVEIAPPSTIADGARTLSLGRLNFAIIREHVRDIVTIDDERLLYWTRFAINRTKLLIEPTGALGLAALLEGRLRPRGPVAVVVSGGNADWSVLCKG